jgi:hypothetical protein
MKKIWDDPPIVVTVSRKDVESNYTQPTLRSLWPLVRDAEQVRSSLGRLVLSFEGFGKDAGTIWFDEVWQVPEARLFVEMLAQEFPFWFFLADLSGDTLYRVAACVCRVEVRGSETIFNKDDLLAFSVNQFDGMNRLYEQWDLPQEEKAERVEQVTQYFARVPVE